jgi:tetratricopeptide (TPR) repeat protein
MMAQILRQMSYFESSIPHWLVVSQRDMAARDEGRLELGAALFRMGRAAEAVRFLEKPFEAVPLERARQLLLAECDLELELYPEALKVVQEWPAVPGVARIRHRALSYQGRPDEARKAIEALEGKTSEDRHIRSMMEVSFLREEGDFAAAGKALEAAARELRKGSPEWAKVKRSEIALRIESGEGAALAAVVDELSDVQEGHVKGVALWGRVIALLSEGKPEAAVAAANDFLSQTEPEYTPLRMERLMMLHLTGKMTDEAFEAEIRVMPRGWQNDLLYYLALARGKDRSVAERALRATPGRNFPYHAIRRLLAP